MKKETTMDFQKAATAKAIEIGGFEAVAFRFLNEDGTPSTKWSAGYCGGVVDGMVALEMVDPSDEIAVAVDRIEMIPATREFDGEAFLAIDDDRDGSGIFWTDADVEEDRARFQGAGR